MIDMHGWMAAAGLGAIALAAGCSSGSNSSGGAAGQQSGSGTTVAVRKVSGAEVLVNSSGRTLYTSEQEASGRVLCASSDCTAIWTPVTVAKGQQPTGPSGVAGQLGTVKRPDGSVQVTFKGGPLYTFTFDHAAGEVNGNGTKDSFDGTNFVWHAATAKGVSVSPSTGASTPGGYGNGGYGY